MLIEVDEHDQRPRFVQGLEDISPEEVIRKRQCVFTNLEYKLLDTRLLNTHVPARLRMQNEMKSWLFNHGKLICRWVYIVELHRTGKSCGGEARRMFKWEAASYTENERSADSPSRPQQKDAPSSDPDVLPHGRTSDSRKRKPSSQEIPGTTKRPQRVPRKRSVLTFGDGYCGCGGTSEGARQAGYKIVWGLEKDSLAMAAYRKNFPEAMHLEMDAHNFTDIARRRIHGCDHLHMSCPCCFWSIAQ
jgi:DNA (cytosine-5)-methyltransferase 1